MKLHAYSDANRAGNWDGSTLTIAYSILTPLSTMLIIHCDDVEDLTTID